MAYERLTKAPALKPKEGYVTLTSGISGHFAVQVWFNPEGFEEPYDTGIGRYATQVEAAEEAVMWADDQDLPCVLPMYIWEELQKQGLIEQLPGAGK